MLRIVSVVLIAVIWAPTLTSAQAYPVDRGSWILGGQASFTSSSGRYAGMPEPRETRLDMMPSVHYFVRPGLALGLEGILAWARTRGSTAYVTGVGPAATYFFGRERRVYPYLGAGAYVGRLESSYHTDAQLAGAKVAGGSLFMLSPTVALNGQLFQDWQWSRDSMTDGGRWISTGMAVGVTAFIF